MQTRAEKKLRFGSSSPLITVHLKRFEHLRTGATSKNETSVYVALLFYFSNLIK